MPVIRDLVLLLTGYELDSYPRDLDEPQASELLEGWLALWEPALIANAETCPRWQSAEQIPTELDDLIIVEPGFSSELVGHEDRQRIEGSTAVCLTGEDLRVEKLEKVQGELRTQFGLGDATTLENELRETFQALGYAFLQIQLMTRQLRYTSSLDVALFNEQLVGAAKETVERGNREEAERLLQSCFDSLGEERDHYYSLTVNLLDVTLVTESTLGRSFESQIDDQCLPSTFVASGQVLQKLKHKKRSVFDKLGEGVQDGRLALAGGLATERPLPLLHPDAVQREFERGRAAYAACGLPTPSTFARLGFGLDENSPTILKHNLFQQALLIAWTDGEYPEASQAKISWEAQDGARVQAITPLVIDGTQASSFVDLGWVIGEILDHQHVPTLVFAHWPGVPTRYYRLLQIVSQKTPALGMFTNVDSYFSETDEPYHHEQLPAEAFKKNWLREWEPSQNLIDRIKLHYVFSSQLHSLNNLATLAWQLKNAGKTLELESDVPGEQENAPVALVKFSGNSESNQVFTALEELANRVDSLLDEGMEFDADAIAQELENVKKQVLTDLSLLVAGRETEDAEPHSQHIHTLFNPYSSAQRFVLELPCDQCFDEKEVWQYRHGRADSYREALLDVSSFGFICAETISVPPNKTGEGKVLAQARGFMQNEFVEVQIDNERGNLRSLHVPAVRGNRLGFQVSHRCRNKAGDLVYSEMDAADVRLIQSSNVFGHTRSNGKLVSEGTKIGEFEIDYCLHLGSRIVEILVKLDHLRGTDESNPWQDAFVARFAWANESARLNAYHGSVSKAWHSGIGFAPTLIEVDDTSHRTQILTAGLGFHRRVENRFLESILSFGNKTSVEQRIGVAVDLPHAVTSATRFLENSQYHLELTGNRKLGCGWLANSLNKNVELSLVGSLADGAGRQVGMRVRVAETAGKSTNAKVQLMRNIQQAYRVDAAGVEQSQLGASEDTLEVRLRTHERVFIDVIWKL